MPRFGMRPLLAMMGLVSKPSMDAAQEAATGRRAMNLVDPPLDPSINPKGKLARKVRYITPKQLRDKIDKWCHAYNSKVRTRQIIRHSLRRYCFAQFREEFDGELRYRLRKMARNKMHNMWGEYAKDDLHGVRHNPYTVSLGDAGIAGMTA